MAPVTPTAIPTVAPVLRLVGVTSVLRLVGVAPVLSLVGVIFVLRVVGVTSAVGVISVLRVVGVLYVLGVVCVMIPDEKDEKITLSNDPIPVSKSLKVSVQVLIVLVK